METMRQPLYVRQGSRFIQPIDITTGGVSTPLPAGTTARMQVRASYDSSVILADLTTVNGGLLIDVGAARVTINLTSAATGAYTWRKGVYDLQLVYESGETDRILEGTITVSPSVTR